MKKSNTLRNKNYKNWLKYEFWYLSHVTINMDGCYK